MTMRFDQSYATNPTGVSDSPEERDSISVQDLTEIYWMFDDKTRKNCPKPQPIERDAPLGNINLIHSLPGLVPCQQMCY